MRLFRRRRDEAPPPPPPTTIQYDAFDQGSVATAWEPLGQSKAFSGSPALVSSLRRYGPWPWTGFGGALYRSQPAVRSVVDFLAHNIAQLNLKVYRRQGDTDRVELDDHALAELIRSPNPRSTRFRILRDTVSDFALEDVAYWRKIRRRGEIVAILWVPRTAVQEETVTVNGSPTPVRRYWIGGELVPRDDLVIFSGYHPEGGEQGVPPVETLRRILEEDAEAVAHRAGYWRHATRQSGVIERPLEAPVWSDPARSRFRADWEASWTGEEGSGRTPVLEDGMRWNPASFSPKDSLYVEGRELTYREVAMSYFGPIVGRQWAEATGAGTAENHRQLYQDVLGPWLSFIQDEIALQLLPDVDAGGRRIYVEFNLAEKLKGSFEEQANTLTTTVGVPSVAVNEARARLNLPRLDNPLFDLPVMPLNVLYGGQPSTQTPTADPGTPTPPQETEPGTASIGPPAPIPLAGSVKAAPRGAVRRRDQAADAQTAAIRAFLARQGEAVTRLLGARKAAKADVDPGDVWATERWNRELLEELERAALPLVAVNGQRAAAQIAGVFDFSRTIAWVQEDARIAAERINAHTLEDLRRALAGADDVLAAARASFEAAGEGRAAQLGLSRATTLVNWARLEAGKQSSEADGRLRTKTWVVSSGNSRHRSWNGDTVPVGRKFPNGADAPGDYVLGVDHVAGCRCLMDLRYVRS